jgi:hypothetical protein
MAYEGWRASHWNCGGDLVTDTFDAVLADVREEAERRDYQDGVLTTDEVRYHLDRLAAAHAAEVAERDARLAELEAHAADRESEIEAIKAERARAEDQAEAASGQGVVPEPKVVPYGSASGEKDYAYGYEKGHADGWNACRNRMLDAIPPGAGQ